MMHESGLVRDLIRRAEAAAREAGAERVSAVTVSIGPLAGFTAAHFREHFETDSRGTLVEGAVLRITADDGTDLSQDVVLRSLDLDIADPES